MQLSWLGEREKDSLVHLLKELLSNICTVSIRALQKILLIGKPHTDTLVMFKLFERTDMRIHRYTLLQVDWYQIIVCGRLMTFVFLGFSVGCSCIEILLSWFLIYFIDPVGRPIVDSFYIFSFLRCSLYKVLDLNRDSNSEIFFPSSLSPNLGSHYAGWGFNALDILSRISPSSR